MTLPTGIAVLLVLVISAGSTGLTQEANAGLDTFVANGCHQCHGYDGQGGAAGPRIAPSVYPYDLFARLVRRPANVMPAYAPEVLADADLRTIYDYVLSIPEPPAVDAIDILAERR
jgi:mono/diheme cytochrome c family protein